MQFHRLFAAVFSFLLASSGFPPLVIAQTTAIPTPSATLAPGVAQVERHIVERLTVYTSRNATIVKAKLQQQLGNLTQSSLLTAATDSQANYTAAVNHYKGPAGYI
ncbi:hypothetical protein H072_5066 [Dactylellina haptotyla CBS 200.50]|uniref:Uncharacterized protein n=1 Tax=Dactylellina haptotyla (strain CBS 200.50) TaxID=1284197 RepID=S8AIR5_DACHA|nr:hypothetical protein H072_5066 [Dactylellina haptotyla CBS 200.50]